MEKNMIYMVNASQNIKWKESSKGYFERGSLCKGQREGVKKNRKLNKTRRDNSIKKNDLFFIKMWLKKSGKMFSLQYWKI